MRLMKLSVDEALFVFSSVSVVILDVFVVDVTRDGIGGDGNDVSDDVDDEKLRMLMSMDVMNERV